MTVIDIKQEERKINFEILKPIEDDTAQKKCYVAELTRTALNKFLDYDGLVANNSNSLYKLPIVNEETEIIDFEINSLSVHVIPTIGKSKNVNVYIPKDYKTYSCKPDIIIFVNFTKTLSKMTVVGYVTGFDNNTQAIRKSDLNSPENLISALKTLIPKNYSSDDGVINAAKELMLAYISSSLSEEGHQFFLKHLIANIEIRKNYKLFYALNCKFICVAKSHSDLTDDSFVAIDSVPDETDYISEENVSEAASELQENIIDTEAEKTSETAENVEDIGITDEETNLQEVAALPDESLLDNSDEFAELLDEPMLSDEDMPMVENIDITDDDFELHEAENDLNSDVIAGGESIELGLDDEDIGLTDLSEESPILLNEESVGDDIKVNLLDENNSLNATAETGDMPESVDLIQPVQEEQPAEEPADTLQAEAENQGDDLFSFLSEMADESQTENELSGENAEQEVISQDDILPEESSDVSEPDIAENQISEEQVSDRADTENTPLQEEAEDGIPSLLNDAFTKSAESTENMDIELSRQTTPKPGSAKNFVMPLAAAFLLVIIAGTSYVLKDNIASVFNKDSQDLAFENTKTEINKDEELPPPINTTTLPAKGNGQQDAANVPPPIQQPTQGKNNMPNPPAPSSQQLPGLPTTVEPPKPKNINDALAIALTKDFSGVRISKISWEISETLLANEEVKRYLVIAGKSIKNALSKDLMAATEPSFKDNVVINITYRKDGSISQIKMGSSSGSSQIDEIMVKTVRDTLNYVKMPAVNINKPEYTAKLVVRL